MTAIGECCLCRTLFSFNPLLVPSWRGYFQQNGKFIPDERLGTREPICQSCIQRINAAREKQGMTAITIMPGAYEPEELA